MFGEVGEAVMPDYGWLDAVGGIISEAIYCPLSAFVVMRFLRRGDAQAES